MQLGNNRIAKNTFMLYLRMLISTVVSLYTSRIVLNVLGVEDYGIYNIVGGVIVLFSFLNSSLTTASQRYLSIAVAAEDKENEQRLFSSVLMIHIAICVVVFLLAETIGLWFFIHKIDIPSARIGAAHFVYQTALVNTMWGIMKVPYNAAIIANEHMSFYAYTSIAESLMKLCSVYLLLWILIDKLVLYSLLGLTISIIVFCWYKYYVEHHFVGYKFRLVIDKIYLRQLINFSSWNLFGGVADLANKQGSNILLNMFCGVVLNAALGIASTVRSTLFSFVSNLQIAANPQIIKSYSLGELSYYRTLVFRISKYSFYLMLLLAIPFTFNVDYILKLWLITPPPYTASFLILMMLFSLIDALHGPLWISVQAVGVIRNYQIVTSIVTLLNLPLSYWALSKGAQPEVIIIISIFVSIAVLAVRLIYSKILAKISLTSYFSRVISPICLVTILSLPLPFYLSTRFSDSFEKLIVVGGLGMMCVIVSIMTIGVTHSERRTLVRMFSRRFVHKRK